MNEILIDYLRDHSSPLEPIATGEKAILGKLKGIRAVVFDIYGTLLISAAGDISLAGGEIEPERAIVNALTASGVTQLSLSKAELLSGYKDKIKAHQEARSRQGIQFPEIEIRKVWRELIEECDGDPTLADLACVVYECQSNPVWKMPNMDACLNTLRDRGVTMGIISNAQFYTPLIFNTFCSGGLSDFGFDSDLLVYSFEHLEGKPSTVLYQIMADRLRNLRGIDPAEVLYVGNDRLKDIWPAQQVGFKTALFAGDKRSLRWHNDDPRLQGVTPELVVTDLHQIIDSIDA